MGGLDGLEIVFSQMCGEFDHQPAFGPAEYRDPGLVGGIDRCAERDQDGAASTLEFPSERLEFIHDFFILEENDLAV